MAQTHSREKISFPCTEELVHKHYCSPSPKKCILFSFVVFSQSFFFFNELWESYQFHGVICRRRRRKKQQEIGINVKYLSRIGLRRESIIFPQAETESLNKRDAYYYYYYYYVSVLCGGLQDLSLSGTKKRQMAHPFAP